MKNFSLYLALRYLRGARNEKSIATMVTISLLSIVISTLCLALVAIIMRGFEKETFNTLQGCHAPLCIQSYGNHLAFDSIENVLKNEFPNLSYSPSDIQYGMLEDRNGTLSHLIALKGVEPQLEAQTTTLEKKILPHNNQTISILQALENRSVLIGYQLAKMLNVRFGQHLTIYYVPEQHAAHHSLTLEKADLQVGGIFKTGIEEFDSNLVLCSLATLQSLFQESGITSISLSPHSSAIQLEQLQQQLTDRFDLPIYSWKDRYPALIAALKLETYASFIILCLIVLIASMSILSLLFMQITQKRGNIAILKTLGASKMMIKKIFIFMGLIIAFFGALIGLVLALLIALLLHSYIRIELPDAYYVTQLPVSIEPSIFIFVFLIVMVISFIATWLPTRSIDTINIANVLRFEA